MRSIPHNLIGIIRIAANERKASGPARIEFRVFQFLVPKSLKYLKINTTDCQPDENVEALRVFMLAKKIECRPVWKPMHKQPVYEGAPVYTDGVEEDLFKVGSCLPAGPYVTDDDVRYIVECIKDAIVR